MTATTRPVWVIGISGGVATGTTSVGEPLADALGVPFHSGGSVPRRLWKQERRKGEKLGAFIKRNRNLDQKIEAINRQFVIDHQKTGCVIECRLPMLALKGIENGRCVYLDCEDAVRFRRYAKREHCSLKRARIEVPKRDRDDLLRYREKLGIWDYTNPAYYDLILDTTRRQKLDTVQAILHFLQTSKVRISVSPVILVP